MLRLYTDVVIHVKKQSMSETVVVDASGVSDAEISDFMDVVRLLNNKSLLGLINDKYIYIYINLFCCCSCENSSAYSD